MARTCGIYSSIAYLAVRKSDPQCELTSRRDWLEGWEARVSQIFCRASFRVSWYALGNLMLPAKTFLKSTLSVVVSAKTNGITVVLYRP